MQARTRRLRLAPRIVQDSSNKARRRKLFSPGAMVDLEENLLNGHQRSSLRWTSRRSLGRARPKVRADCTHHVPPNGDPSHPRKSEVYSVSVGLGRSSEGSDIAAARQSERIDLSVARAKVPRVRNSLRKNSTSSVITPLPHSLIVQPSSETSAASPEGEAAQGPSPID
jgi:hypothetical protein